MCFAKPEPGLSTMFTWGCLENGLCEFPPCTVERVSQACLSSLSPLALLPLETNRRVVGDVNTPLVGLFVVNGMNLAACGHPRTDKGLLLDNRPVPIALLVPNLRTRDEDDDRTVLATIIVVIVVAVRQAPVMVVVESLYSDVLVFSSVRLIGDHQFVTRDRFH